MHTLTFKKKLYLLRQAFFPVIRKKIWMSHLWVTRKCNIHCKFCYIRDYSSPDPSLEELNKRLDKLKELGCRSAVIMGGEPTLRKDLPEIIKSCKERDIVSYLVTNGTLLNKKLIDELGKNGLDMISISFDALEFKDNLLIRYGKYECDPREKLDLLKYCQEKYGCMAFVAICITNHNVDEIIPLMEMAKNYNLAITLTIMADPYIIPDPKHKNWKNEKDSVLFKREQEVKKLKELIKKLIKMKKEGCRIFEPYAYFYRVLDMLDGKKVKKFACKSGTQYLDINTDGKIMLCVMSDPIDVHYSELTSKNYIEKLKPYTEKQLSCCTDKCMLAAYFDTTYYASHIPYFIWSFRKIF